MGPGRGLLGVACVLALVAFLPAVSAHAELLYSSPPKGAMLDEAPQRVSVTFTENVERVGTRLEVMDAQGNRVDTGDVRFDGEQLVSVGLPADLPHGAYLVGWWALSGLDNHPTHGTFGFAVGAFQPPESGRDESIPVQSAIARFITYTGFSLAFGAAAFLLWMRPFGFPGQWARIALLAGATLHLAGVALQAAGTAAASGITLGSLATFEAGQWRLFAVAAGAVAWVLAFVWAARPVAAGPAVVVAILLSSAIASARLGHPNAHGAAAIGLDFVHLVSAATWAGGLVLLLAFVRRARARGDPIETLRHAGVRFGTLALVCVVLLASTGVVLSVFILGTSTLADPAALLGTPYGLVLSGKVALAALMVALAAVNRYVLLAGPADSGLAGSLQKAARKATAGRIQPGMAVERFGRTLGVEAALGVGVLLLAGLLTAGPPPSNVEPAVPDIVVEGAGAHYRVVASSAPPQVTHRIMLHLKIVPLDPADPLPVNNTCGRSAGESCVTVRIAYGTDAAGEEHDAMPGGGSWMLHEGIWAREGPATVTVHISTREHFQDTVQLRFDVAP